MCGIVGYIGNKKDTLDILMNGLKHLEYRGYDSSGIAYMTSGRLVIKKEAGKLENLKETIDFNDKSNIGIGHTRWATHGVANKINSHPHKFGDIVIVHNGIIENYLELKQKLIKKGYEFISETDTEVAAALLNDLYIKDYDMLKAIEKFKEIVKGTYAIIVMSIKENNCLYVIKKGSPLVIGISDDGYYIGSDILAFIKYTNKYVTLLDYEYAKIDMHKLTIFSETNQEKEYTIDEIDIDNNEVSKNGYKHYMLKEINDEPTIVRKILNNKIDIDLKKYKKIIIVGCGSAMHAGVIGVNLLREYANIDANIEIASEFRYKKLFLDKDSLVMAISQSGETADTLEAVKIAKEHGAYTIGIVNVKDSSIARCVDNVIYTECGPEIAVATTKAYLGQVLIMILLTVNNCIFPELVKEFKKDINKLPILVQNLIDNTELIQKLAKKIYKREHLFFIGRGIDYAISLEGSLKLKEISYIHSEAYAAGELKHGTISLIDKDTPVIGIVTDKKIADKTISNMKEVKARGAYVIYVTLDSLYKEGDFYDDVIIIPTLNELLNPILTIIPLQLLAYYVAKLKKCDIDKPKNLAKSVTVE